METSGSTDTIAGVTSPTPPASNGEQPTAPVFIDGEKAATLRGPTLAADFKQMVVDYIERRFGSATRGATERLEAVEA